MTPDLRGRILRACALHTPARGVVEALDDVLIEIDAQGVISALHRAGTSTHAETLASAGARLAQAPAGTILVPGLVDLHVHAPQYPQLGTALDLALEDWLQDYTFPLEAGYADSAVAARVYPLLVAELLGAGTTTAVYFATIHDEATIRLADECIAQGQRAFVGRVAMDHPDTCPATYRDASAAEAIAGTRRVINHIRNHPGNARARVRPIITPRFVPACTDALLAGLGDLARETGVAVTTHVSESDWEHQHVLARHGCTDTQSLDRFGLLPQGSVLAHACFIDCDDMALIARRAAGVAHCPWSNAYFAGAAFPLRQALDAGVRTGLGSDISGGPTATIWEAARTALIAARMLASGTDAALPPEDRSAQKDARIDAVTAFWLATAGGAEVLGLSVGHFAPSHHFDALTIDPHAPGGGLAHWPLAENQTPARRLERLLHGTARVNIAAVHVDGVRVAGHAAPA
jgi:guanine deaminase